MEIIIGIGLLGAGVALGMYISSQIERHIDTSMEESDEIDTKNKPSTQIFKEDAIVKKIWSYTYIDENGNKIEIPDKNQNSTTDVITDNNDDDDEEREYSCCGDDITDNDIKLCPTCLEHQ